MGREVVRETVPPQWTALAWVLERRFPGEFGRRVIEHDGGIDLESPLIEMIFDDGDGERRAQPDANTEAEPPD